MNRVRPFRKMLQVGLIGTTAKQLVNDSRAPFAEYAAEVIGEASVDLSADCRKGKRSDCLEILALMTSVYS